MSDSYEPDEHCRCWAAAYVNEVCDFTTNHKRGGPAGRYPSIFCDFCDAQPHMTAVGTPPIVCYCRCDSCELGKAALEADGKTMADARDGARAAA